VAHVQTPPAQCCPAGQQIARDGETASVQTWDAAQQAPLIHWWFGGQHWFFGPQMTWSGGQVTQVPFTH
jgi:hypothetical protein